jgi:beta-glucanase (GH16 family)
VREFHTYTAVWTPDDVTFFVDGQHVKTVGQSPSYPMQFMLGIYEFADETAAPHGSYPKQFTVDYFRGWRRVATE